MTGNLLLFAEVEAFHYSEYDHIATILFMYAHKSPFLMEELFQFWLGGIEDNAVWTQRCWEDVVRWLENGVDDKICIVEPQDQQARYSLDSRKSFRNSVSITFAVREFILMQA